MKKQSGLLNLNLEAFIAVSECKTVHAAARAINISQTAVTQRILSLEKKLTTTLFIRTRQGMILTTEGEKLLRYCHTVTHYSHETLADMVSAGMESIQRVKISGPSSIMLSRIIPRNLPLMKQFPKLYITFEINDTDKIVTDLRTGVSQFSILQPSQITQDMQTKNLAPEKYLLVCTSQWQHRPLQDIIRSERIIDFDETDQTTINYLKRFNLLQDAQPDRLFVNRNESLSKMLIDGYGYGVLTEEMSKSFLDMGELIALNASKTLDNSLKLAWYERPAPPSYFSAIINSSA